MTQPVHKMPSIEEVLGGQSQGGVPRPAVSTDLLFVAPSAPAPRPLSIWQRVRAFFGAL